MKKAFILIALSVFLVNCSKNDSSNNGIIIKGLIPESIATKSGDSKSSKGVALTDAKKVLVFSKYYYSLSDITNGAFSVTGKIGTGVALIFLDASNKYIGTLSPQGLNMLPLGSLSNGENTIIDLSTLTLVGSSVIPSHDPLGKEIPISETEINGLKAIGGYYESIAKNIDADNDGIPDILSNKQLIMSTIYGITCGHWGYNNTLPVLNDDAHFFVNYNLVIEGGKSMSFSDGSINLSGPEGDPYSDISTWGYNLITDSYRTGFVSTFCRLAAPPAGSPWGNAALPFKKGTYTLTLDGIRKFTLDYSSIDFKQNLVLVIPTLHTNSEGKLTSVSLEYKLQNGTVIDPSNMLTNIMIQLSDNQHNQFYVNANNKLTSITGFKTITPDTPVDISSLASIDLWYDDLLGNQYDIIWN
jgi:hypothetical protein